MRLNSLHLALASSLTVAALAAGLAAQPSGAPPRQGRGGQASAPVTAVEGTGAISGVVTDGQTGRALTGAVAQLQGGGRGVPSFRQSTDEKGRFIFIRLPPSNTYTVVTTKIGYVESRSGARIALADGQWFADAKVTLWKLGAIGGTVVDESGEPVVGIYVHVLVKVLVSGRPQLASGPTGRTDDRGVYRIAGLEPGQYVVSVPSIQWSVPADLTDAALSGYTPQGVAQMEAAGRTLPPRRDQTLSPDGKNLLMLGSFATPPPPSADTARAYPTTFVPSVSSLADASAVDLKRGEERSNVDVQLRPVRAVRVAGALDAPAGSEPGGLTLRLVPVGLESLANGSEAATALTTGDGRFTFLNVPSGDYTLIASRSQMEYQSRRAALAMYSVTLPSPPGSAGVGGGGGTVASATSGTEYNYRTASGSTAFAGRMHVAVGDRDVTDLVVPFRRGVTISGRIVYEDDAKPPERPSGFGPPVYAEPASGDAALGMPVGRVTFGADTVFSVEGLQPGAYVLRFLTLAAAGMIKSIVSDGHEYTAMAFDASGGRDITDVVVTVTSKAAKLNGFARDDHGQVLSHGSVIVFPQERAQWTGYGFTPSRIVSIPIASDGSYSNPRLRPGDYYVIAVDDSLASAWQDPKFLEAAAPLASQLSLHWDESKVLDVVTQQVPGFRAGGRP